MNKRIHSRRQLFEDVEHDLLRPLPPQRFRLSERVSLTVLKNGYITLNRHHYSLSRQYVGKRVDVVYDTDYVQIFHGLRLVATHRRDDTPYEYTQKEEHNLPGRHGSYESDMQQLYADAASVDNILVSYLRDVASAKKYPAQGFRSCRGIMTLLKKYGTERLVAACAYAGESHLYGYNEVLSILKDGADLDYINAQEDDFDSSPQPIHSNIRGRDYYCCKQDNNSSNNNLLNDKNN